MTWLFDLPETRALRALSRDGWLLFITRILRMFAYGFISVILVLYLTAQEITQIGLILAATLYGDLLLSLWITLVADRIGRRRMLQVGAGLIIFGGVILAFTGNVVLLLLAAFIGTISPTGSEVGPFLSIEQAALPQTIPPENRTSIFAWYNLVGSFSTAFGALAAGTLAGILQRNGMTPLMSYRVILLLYALLGVVLFFLFARLTAQIEAAPQEIQSDAEQIQRRFGLHRSRNVVFGLAALFMVDSFGGGLVVQSIIAYWFSLKFKVSPEALGGIFFGANLLAGLSALAAGRLATRIGLINTMVWTHIPSNILLILVPLMPTLPLAILVLLLRFSISQMDVPTRQSYVMAVVAPDERSAAAGVTTLARTVTSALGPIVTQVLFTAGFLSVPFFLAGTLKIGYDLALYRSFNAIKPPEEQSAIKNS